MILTFLPAGPYEYEVYAPACVRRGLERRSVSPQKQRCEHQGDTNNGKRPSLFCLPVDWLVQEIKQHLLTLCFVGVPRTTVIVAKIVIVLRVQKKTARHVHNNKVILDVGPRIKPEDIRIPLRTQIPITGHVSRNFT